MISKNQKESKKHYTLYLSVAFFFALFSFGKVEAFAVTGGYTQTNATFISGTTYCIPRTDTPWDTGEYGYFEYGNYTGTFTGIPRGVTNGASGTGGDMSCENGYNFQMGVPGGTADLTNGTQTIIICAGSDIDHLACSYVLFTVTGGTPTQDEIYIHTKINTVTPYNNQILATSTNYTIGSTGYLEDIDLNSQSKLKISIKSVGDSFVYNQCADAICAQLANKTYEFDYALTTASPYSYSSTTPLNIGDYNMTTWIEKGKWCVLDKCLLTERLTSTTTTFTISTSSENDLRAKRTQAVISTMAGFATSTDFSKCAIADFNLLICGQDILVWAFYPTPDAIEYNMTNLKNNALTHFPLGYLTDFVTIISTTTEGTLPIINATMPNALGLGNGHIEISLDHSLDYILNATSTIFNNDSASSTETFLEITKWYWDRILYILALMYIISRILGTRLINKKHQI